MVPFQPLGPRTDTFLSQEETKFLALKSSILASKRPESWVLSHLLLLLQLLLLLLEHTQG